MRGRIYALPREGDAAAEDDALYESAGKVFRFRGEVFVLTHGGALPLRPQGVSSPLVNRTPKGRGAKAEINLAIVSDSLPLGTPSLTAKPKLLVIANPA